MKNLIWKSFELECVNYLTKHLHNQEITYKGQSNSKTSDIKVDLPTESFYIEVKLCPSHSGQFVVEIDEKEFLLKDIKNKYSVEIINYMNQYYKDFKMPSQKSNQIKCDKSILYSFIREHYTEKNTKFFIVSTELGSYKTLLSMDELEEYFDIKAVLRRKKSGSYNLPKRDVADAITSIREHFSNLNVDYKIFYDEKKLTIRTSRLLIPKERDFGNGYYFSEITPNSYKVTKKSNTNNPTVLIKLLYKGPKANIGLDKVTEYIESKTKNIAN